MIQMVISKQSWISALCPLGALLAGTMFYPFSSHGASSREFIITSKGLPKAEIVMTEHAKPPVLFAAQELQRYVKEISLEAGIFGLTGYQASGARDPEKWKDPGQHIS